MIVVKPKVELLYATPDIEKCIEIAGRTCYKSEDKITPDSSGKFVSKLRKLGHHAMLEFGDVTFRITTDRGITHEIVRHRLASFAQESTRYCNYTAEKFGMHCSFIEPPGMDEEATKIWWGAIHTAETAYFDLINEGCSPQIARSVLPNALKAEIVMKCNTREWMHFCKLRNSSAAHPQMRQIARMVLRELKLLAPNVFDDLV